MAIPKGFIGHVATVPEMRYVPSGNAVTSFLLAENDRYRNSDGETVETTEWYRVNCWGRLAETTNEYLQKGRQVYVSGKLTHRPYTANDGEIRPGAEIMASAVEFLGSRGDADGGSAGSSQTSGAAPDDEEDVPW